MVMTFLSRSQARLLRGVASKVGTPAAIPFDNLRRRCGPPRAAGPGLRAKDGAGPGVRAKDKELLRASLAAERQTVDVTGHPQLV